MVLFSFIQGFTEFLPVSSSAHLLTLPHILGGPDQGLVMDIAAHAGSLLAVLATFRKRAFETAAALFSSKKSAARDLVLKLSVATAPFALVASIMFLTDINLFRHPAIAVFTLAVFGILLWAADRRFHGEKDERGLSFKDALIIGCGQALAVVPGVSRSGICLTFGLARGMGRKAAVEFAFLLSIPTMTLAGAGATLEYMKEGAQAPALHIVSVGALSFLFSLAAIRLMLAWVSKFSLAAFAAYRIVLAALLAHLLFW
jgi:undecaprenyl-diphosphatase